MKTILKSVVVMVFVIMIMNQMLEINNLIIPIQRPLNQVANENPKLKQIKEDLAAFGAPKEKIDRIAHAVKLSSDASNYDSRLIVTLMYTESTFDENACSPKGYCGLLQTPYSTGYPDVDTLWGMRLLQEKMRYSKGDLKKALALYKGGNNPVAKRQAERVLELYEKLQEGNINNGRESKAKDA